MAVRPPQRVLLHTQQWGAHNSKPAWSWSHKRDQHPHGMGLYRSMLGLTCIFPPRRATERHHHPHQQLLGMETRLYRPARSPVRPQRDCASQKRCPALGTAPGPGRASSPEGHPQPTTELCQGPNCTWASGGAGSGRGAELKAGSRASVHVLGPPFVRAGASLCL